VNAAGDEVDVVLGENLDRGEFSSGFEELDIGDYDGVVNLLSWNVRDEKVVLGEIVIQIVIDSLHFLYLLVGFTTCNVVT